MVKFLLMLIVLTSLMGCEAISGLLPKKDLPPGAVSADLILHVGTTTYTYLCTVDAQTKALIDCKEVQ